MNLYHVNPYGEVELCNNWSFCFYGKHFSSYKEAEEHSRELMETLYSTEFLLTDPVLDITEANKFLRSWSSLENFSNDNLRSKLKKITWKLYDEQNGTIYVTSIGPLDEQELYEVSNFISEEIQFRLWQEFSKQSFACYDVTTSKERYYWYNKDIYGHYAPPNPVYITVEFQSSNYKLTRESRY